jgi:hypothetical protein
MIHKGIAVALPIRASLVVSQDFACIRGIFDMPLQHLTQIGHVTFGLKGTIGQSQIQRGWVGTIVAQIHVHESSRNVSPDIGRRGEQAIATASIGGTTFGGLKASFGSDQNATGTKVFDASNKIWQDGRGTEIVDIGHIHSENTDTT